MAYFNGNVKFFFYLNAALPCDGNTNISVRNGLTNPFGTVPLYIVYIFADILLYVYEMTARRDDMVVVHLSTYTNNSRLLFSSYNFFFCFFFSISLASALYEDKYWNL